MSRRHYSACPRNMSHLVVEEYVGAEFLEYSRFLDATQKEHLIYLDAPLPKRRHHSLMGGGVSRGHNRNANARLIFRICLLPCALSSLKLCDFAKEATQRASWHRHRGRFSLRIKKGSQTTALENRLRGIIC